VDQPFLELRDTLLMEAPEALAHQEVLIVMAVVEAVRLHTVLMGSFVLLSLEREEIHILVVGQLEVRQFLGQISQD
jgi:hypothetical protein